MSAFFSRSHALFLLAASRLWYLFLVLLVARVVCLRNVMLILTLRHAWVPLNDFRFIIRVSYMSVLLLSAWIVRNILLVLLVENLSHVCTWLIVTETWFTLVLTLSNDFFAVVCIRWCSFFVLLSGTFLECLIMSIARIMVMGNYRLLQSVGIWIVSNVLLRHHQLLVRVLWWISLAVLYAERVGYVDSVVRFACEVTWGLLCDSLTHKCLLLICESWSVKLFLFAQYMSGVFAVEILVVIRRDCRLVEAVRFEHLLLGQSAVGVLVRGCNSHRWWHLLAEVACQRTSLITCFTWLHKSLRKLTLTSCRARIFTAVEVLLYRAGQVFTNNSSLVGLLSLLLVLSVGRPVS